MSLINFKNWILQQESSASTRARSAAALGLMPMAVVGSPHGRSTASAFEISKIKKAVKGKKKIVNKNTDVDKFINQVEELEKELKNLKDVKSKKSKEIDPKEDKESKKEIGPKEIGLKDKKIEVKDKETKDKTKTPIGGKVIDKENENRLKKDR